MDSSIPGINPLQNNTMIKKHDKEAFYSGTSPVLLLEINNKEDQTECTLSATENKERIVSMRMKSNWTLLSFMEECLWSIHSMNPCFSYTITDAWLMKKEENLTGIVTAFNNALSLSDTPLCLYLEDIEKINDEQLTHFLVSLAESFPDGHKLTISGHTISKPFKELKNASYKTITIAPSASNGKQFESAMERDLYFGNLALDEKNIKSLEQTFIHSHRSIIQSGRTWALDAWAALLEKEVPSPELSGALGAYFTATADYDKAADYLSRTMEESDPGSSLHIQSVLNRAQLIRQTESCEASNDSLNPMIFELEDLSTETAYFWLAEKIHNLLLQDNWVKADELVRNLITICDIAGNSRVKKWYERAMVPICYRFGKIKEAVHYYEQSFNLSKDDQLIVQQRNVNTFAAKAYFFSGEMDKAIALMEESIQNLKKEGRIQELQSHYQTAGELYFWEALRHEGDKKEAFAKASSEAVHLSGVYGRLICPSKENDQKMEDYDVIYSFIMKEISTHAKEDALKKFAGSSSPFYLLLLNSLALDGLEKGNDQQALYYALHAIEVGEISKQKLETVLSYGFAAIASIRLGIQERAASFVQRFLAVCSQTDFKYLLRIPQLAEPILRFAEERNIEPEIRTSITAE